MIVLAGLLVVATTAPYLLPRDAITPLTGAALWLSVLVLRAMLVVVGALVLVLYLPATGLFQLTTHWCIHAVVPFFATHLGFSGHRLGDAATLLPGLVLGLSLIWAVFAVWRTARAVRRWLRRNCLGEGPRQSLIVGGPDVVVAAAGIRNARVIVSTGALAKLDEQELAAGLEHERGHIARRHPYLALAGSVAFALARVLPGSKDALGRLRFCLERDADEYAVGRVGDPVSLASAICKAAAGQPATSPALAGLAGVGTAARLRFLLDRTAVRPRAWAEASGRALVIAMVTLALVTAAATPALAQAGAISFGEASAVDHCQS
ncbi:MAG TPA: M56 family metallopeptidase [Solirubrobacterales bacterium]|nr:M56 family metallopeptidase [Solirubrobacterales bacterium]